MWGRKGRREEGRKGGKGQQRERQIISLPWNWCFIILATVYKAKCPANNLWLILFCTCRSIGIKTKNYANTIHSQWVLWPSEQMDCRDIFGQVTFAVKCRCFLCWFCLFTFLRIRLDRAKVQGLHRSSVRFVFEWWRPLRKFRWYLPGCRNGLGKNWDRAIAIIPLQLTGQNVVVNTNVNSRALWHSKCPVSYHRLSTLIDQRNSYPAIPCSQGISEYRCRTGTEQVPMNS